MKIYYIFLVVVFSPKCQSVKNNVCNTFIGYSRPSHSKDCYYSADVQITDIEALTNYHVGVAEKYEVYTEDGYILSLSRIPSKNANPKGVVILFHPVSADGGAWIYVGNKSLGFMLHREGYDVWMPSQRGTLPSRHHVNMTVLDFQYWDHSFHEIGIYDFKAVIRFVSNKTNNTNITLIGHSMACSALLVYTSLLPQEAKKYVKVAILISTPAYLRNVQTPRKYLAPFVGIISNIARILGITGYILTDTTNIFQHIYQILLVHYPSNLIVWNLLISSDRIDSSADPATAALFLRKIPRGFSFKIWYHYAQIVNAKGRFQQYDYGKRRNKIMYSSDIPPEYPVKDISIPMHLMYGDKETSCTPIDQKYLFEQLPDTAKQYGIHKMKDMAHIDIFVSKKRKEKVYDHLVMFLRKLYN